MNQSVNLQSIQEPILHFLLSFLKQQHYHFTTITPLSHERILTRKQNQPSKQVTLQDIFGWNLAFSPEDLDQQLFKLLKDVDLIYSKDDVWRSHIRVSSLDEELIIHSAFPTIENDAVFFGPDTYRFNYHLKQYLLQRPDLQRCVEICCGTSAVAMSVAKRFPDSEVFAADINPKALFYSQVNKNEAGLPQLHPVYSNLFANLEGKFDLIFANPPYLIDIHERQYRHGGHLLDGTDLSFNILKEGINRLTPHGSLFLYTGIAIGYEGNKFLEALQDWIKAYPDFSYSYEEIDPDVFGEELEQATYQHIDRIALVLVKIMPR